MRKSTLGAVGLILLASGCATTREAPEAPPAATARKATGNPLARPPEDAVLAWSRRFERHRQADRAACRAALCREAPDLAEEALRRALRGGDDALVDALATASGDPRALASLAARRASPAAHRLAWEGVAAAEQALARGDAASATARAAAARAAFAGDELGRSTADLVLLAAGGAAQDGGDARGALVLAARARRDGDAEAAARHLRDALARAGAGRDAALALAIEDARDPLSPPVPEPELQAWLKEAAALLVARGHALEGLRAAVHASGDERDRRAAVPLVVRAELALGRAPDALERALALAADARARGDRAAEATADGLAGEAFLALERPGDAAGAFERAAELALAQGDVASWARRSLNLVRAHLLRGDAAAAAKVLDGVETSPEVAADGRLAARAGVARALVLAKQQDYAACRAELEKARPLALAAGDVDTLERADTLVSRLGTLGRPGGL